MTARRRPAPAGRDLASLLTEEDHAAMRASVEAAARGDALGAWEHLMRGLVVEGALDHHQVRELAVLGDDAPGWMYSRWAAGQAYRWMLLQQDPRIDDAVRSTIAVAHWDHVQALVDDPVAFREYGTLVAASDWICEQLAVHEFRGLVDFLDLRAEPGLLDRCDQIEQWSTTAMGVYSLEDADGATLTVRDLVEDATYDVLNIGALTDRDRGATVLGRLVPIAGTPQLMFSTRPVEVDPETAALAADWIRAQGPLGWLDALTDGVESGRLERGFSSGHATLYSSDIVPDRSQPDEEDSLGELPGRVVELLDAGLDEYVANGVLLAEFALLAIGVSDRSGAVVGPHLSTALVEPRIVDAISEHCTLPEQEEGWLALADCTTPPVRQRCLELAAECARNRAE